MNLPFPITDLFDPVGVTEWTDLLGQQGIELGSLGRRDWAGLQTKALYTATDQSESGVGGRVDGPGWVVRQAYRGPLVADARAEIAADLSGGVTDLWLTARLDHGIRVLSLSDFDELLGDVDLNVVSVCLDPGQDAMPIASSFLAHARKRGVQSPAGCLGADPLGALASSGALLGGHDLQFGWLTDLALWCDRHASDMRAALVDAAVYQSGGANHVQQLAFSMATAVAYLRALLDRGASIDAAARQIMFRYAVGDDFFSEIAKLRAARWLWRRIVTASGGDEQSATMYMHCRSASASLTQRDPWVNMLRVTSQTAAAALGGADSIESAPFDSAVGPSDALGRRVARNTQAVVRDEAHLDKVADPAGGSWFVEARTEALASAAWDMFAAIEKRGGFVDELRSGRVEKAIAQVADAKAKAAATRRLPVVGVSEFANLGEEALERPSVSGEALEQALRHSLSKTDPMAHRQQWISLSKLASSGDAEPSELTQACVDVAEVGGDVLTMASMLRDAKVDLHIEPVRPWAAVTGWERLRDRSDLHLRKHGSRPRVLLIGLGEFSTYAARATWVDNVLAAGGIESVQASADDAVDTFAGDPFAVAVLCGANAAYPEHEGLIGALKDAGCKCVALAGKLDEPLGDATIHAGGDLLSELQRWHALLEVGQ